MWKRINPSFFLWVLYSLAFGACEPASPTSYFRDPQQLRARKDDHDDYPADACRRHDGASSCADCTSSRAQVGDDSLHYYYQATNEQIPQRSQKIASPSSHHQQSFGRHTPCAWCTLAHTCHSTSRLKEHPELCSSSPASSSSKNASSNSAVYYENDCPLGPKPYPNVPPAFLPDWMGTFRKAGIWRNLTLANVSLPGTHDSLSYDLSLTVSEYGKQSIDHLVHILHILSGGTVQLLPGEVEDFLRAQAKTQHLTLPQQLDNGVRFIDFRLQMEEPNHKSNSSASSKWYSLHFMQSKHDVTYYWHEMRVWMDAHPQEIVVLWLSRQGSTTATGQDQYPGVSVQQKQTLWNATFVAIFQDLLLDTTVSDIWEDTVETLLARNHRLVVFASDYAEFTASSSLALDAKRIQNRYDGVDGVFDEATAFRDHTKYFRNAAANNKAIHDKLGMTLLGMNTPGPGYQIKSSLVERFLGWNGAAYYSCIAHAKLPKMMHWCPETLLDLAQWSNYYNQIAMEVAIRGTSGGFLAETLLSESMRVGNTTSYLAFPNLMYLDALDVDGTIRTGPQLLDGASRGGPASTMDAKYAYVDTLLHFNIRQACGASGSSPSFCRTLSRLIRKRRSRYPKQLWTDVQHGRYPDWPAGGEQSGAGDHIFTVIEHVTWR